jgi:hypothetical protein
MTGVDAAYTVLHDSTRFISPTKTPEYLASGLPAVSTSIRDVVRPCGDAGLVHIADTVCDFNTLVKVGWPKNWMRMTLFTAYVQN